MTPPVCVPCRRSMRCAKNDFLVKDEGMGEHPATYHYGDVWRCPGCGHEIVAGFGGGQFASDLLEDVAATALEYTY